MRGADTGHGGPGRVPHFTAAQSTFRAISLGVTITKGGPERSKKRTQHELAPRGGARKLDPLGFHRRPASQSAIDIGQLRITYEGMGPGAAEFFRSLSAGPARQWGHQARQILLLRERDTTQALDAALLHAYQFGALRFDSVQRILEARHPARTLDEYVAAETADRLHQLLGDRKTPPRDLRDYDRLAGETTPTEDNHRPGETA